MCEHTSTAAAHLVALDAAQLGARQGRQLGELPHPALLEQAQRLARALALCQRAVDLGRPHQLAGGDEHLALVVTHQLLQLGACLGFVEAATAQQQGAGSGCVSTTCMLQQLCRAAHGTAAMNAPPRTLAVLQHPEKLALDGRQHRALHTRQPLLGLAVSSDWRRQRQHLAIVADDGDSLRRLAAVNASRQQLQAPDACMLVCQVTTTEHAHIASM